MASFWHHCRPSKNNNPPIKKTSPFVKQTSPFVKKTSPFVKKTSPFVRKTSPFVKKTSVRGISETYTIRFDILSQQTLVSQKPQLCATKGPYLRNSMKPSMKISPGFFDR